MKKKLQQWKESLQKQKNKTTQKYQALRNEAQEELSRMEQDRIRRGQESEPGTFKYGLSNQQNPVDFTKDVYARRKAQRQQGKTKKQRKNKRKRKQSRN